MIPTATIPLDAADEAKAVLRVLDDLDDHDDVQAVHANFDIPEDLLEAASR
jgi:transcriptional/translational regulatory protein YebC/TACO1